jgi:hypothetical protein
MRITVAAHLPTFFVRRFEIMKRLFVFAASVSLSAALVGVAVAEGNGQNVFGENSPNQNIVQPEQSRGQLGGLASGAPSFANNLRDLRGPGNAVAAQAGPQAAGGAVTETNTAVQSQTVAVERQLIKPIQSFHQLGMVIHHCILHTPHKFQAGPTPFAPVHSTPFIPAVAKTPGDLEIATIGMVADATPQQGPLYRVAIRNNSETPSRHFEVSLIAVRGQLNHDSPVITSHVNEIAAGGEHVLDIQLPIGVMSLGAANALAPFESLVVAIDSFDQLIETNELNNVAILTRGEIALIETAAAATTTTTTVTGPAAGAAPNAAAPNVAAPNGGDQSIQLPNEGEAAPNSTDSAIPTPGAATVAPPAQQNIAPPQPAPQQNVAPQAPPQQNVAPQAPATGNGAPAEQPPQASNNNGGLESLVPQNGGNGM